MDFPGKNTGEGCHFLLQGIFLTQGWNPRLMHWQEDSLLLSHQGGLFLKYLPPNSLLLFCKDNELSGSSQQLWKHFLMQKKKKVFILRYHLHSSAVETWCLFSSSESMYWALSIPTPSILILGALIHSFVYSGKMYWSVCLTYHAIFWAKLQIYYLGFSWSLESNNLYLWSLHLSKC